MEITASQVEQLTIFLQEKEHTGSVVLRPGVNLGDGYVEAVLLDADGEETAAKRILFP